MTMRLGFAILGCVVLAACGDSAVRYPVPAPEITERARIAYASVEVAEVSLPTYAALEEIYVEGPDGGVAGSVARLWADDPTRAITLELARALAEISGAQVAPAPWPFDTFPAARLDVRLEALLPGADGIFRARGQYFVAPDEGLGRARSGVIDLAVAYDVAAGPAALAAARGRLVRDIALTIAREGM